MTRMKLTEIQPHTTHSLQGARALAADFFPLPVELGSVAQSRSCEGNSMLPRRGVTSRNHPEKNLMHIRSACSVVVTRKGEIPREPYSGPSFTPLRLVQATRGMFPVGPRTRRLCRSFHADSDRADGQLGSQLSPNKTHRRQ